MSANDVHEARTVADDPAVCRTAPSFLSGRCECWQQLDMVKRYIFAVKNTGFHHDYLKSNLKHTLPALKDKLADALA